MVPINIAYPRVTWKSQRAWRLLARCKPFYLRRGKDTYFVDAGGWATLMGETQQAAGQAYKLLDPTKKPVAGR